MDIKQPVIMLYSNFNFRPATSEGIYGNQLDLGQ